MAKSTLFEISSSQNPACRLLLACKSLGSSFSPSDHDTEETLGFGVRVTILNLSLFFHNQLTFKKLFFHFAVHCMWKQLMKPSGLSFMRRTHVSRFFKWYWAYLAHSFAQCIKINKNVLSELPKAERSVFNFFSERKKFKYFYTLKIIMMRLFKWFSNTLKMCLVFDLKQKLQIRPTRLLK